MRLIFRFLRPHWKLCLITVFLLIVDVVGALIIPTLASEMMREGEAGAGFSTLAKTAVVMALAAIISGAGGILSGEKTRMDTAFSGYADTSIKANRMFASLDGISFFAVNLFVIIVYTLSGYRVTAGAFHIADIAAIIEYALLALFYLMMAQVIILTLPRAFECANRVRAVLDFSPTIYDRTDKEVWFPASCEDVVKFDHVAFRFADSEEYTLKNLNFSCRRGTTTAIIGGTGSGKSTVASLILRFNDTTDGELLLNNVNIKKMPQRQLRDKIAYVQQRAWLFAGTIAENLRYSNENATNEELWHALDVAQAGDFVRSLPDGLNSFVAQGGTNFSGGQKQRLSIARALVKKPECYIFDDSFSALDFKTDAALRKALAAETKQAAVIIIAQRVSNQFSAIGACVRRAYVRVPR